MLGTISGELKFKSIMIVCNSISLFFPFCPFKAIVQLKSLFSILYCNLIDSLIKVRFHAYKVVKAKKCSWALRVFNCSSGFEGNKKEEFGVCFLRYSKAKSCLKHWFILKNVINNRI